MTGGRLLFISNFDLSRRVKTGHVAATGKLEMDACECVVLVLPSTRVFIL